MIGSDQRGAARWRRGGLLVAGLLAFTLGCDDGGGGGNSATETDGGGEEQTGSLNQACFPNGTCNTGLECEENVCVEAAGSEVGGEGQACYPNGTCNDGLECDNNVCVEAAEPAVGGEGQACYPNGTCDAGLDCQDDVCVTAAAEGGEGQACREDGSCDEGLECNAQSICVTATPRGGAGEACFEDGTCDEGLECSAESLCVTPAPEGGAGEPCRADGSCDEGLECNAESTCVDPAAGEGTLGGPCAEGGVCNEGLECSEANVCGPVTPRGGAGQACREDGSCDEGLECNESTICVAEAPRGGLGQACREDESCDEGLECGEGDVCVESIPAGSLGGACNPGNTCDEGLVCNGEGTCVVNDVPQDALIDVTPAETYAQVGAQIGLKARVYNEEGSLLFNSNEDPIIVDWTSSDPTVVQVDNRGRITVLEAIEAEITAQVRGTSQSFTAVINPGISGSTKDLPEPVFTDMQMIHVDPPRVALDIGGTRHLNVTAVDTMGSPTTLDCGAAGPTLTFDQTYLSASYDGALGAEGIDVEGNQKGFSLMTLDCGGFFASPTIVEVKPAVVIPSPSLESDFGVEPHFLLKGTEIHMVSFDQLNQKLVYTRFDGVWSSEILDGEGAYGHQPQILLDPLNDDRPVVCAQEQQDLSCWTLNAAGFWIKQVAAPGVGGLEYDFDLVALGDGSLMGMFSSGGRLLTIKSVAPSRDDWVVAEVEASGAAYSALATASDGSLRAAYQQNGQAWYAEYYADAESWGSEVLDDASGEPGTHIQLAIGPNHQPQAVYTKNGNLIHAVRAGGVWGVRVVDAVSVHARGLSLALDRHRQPRVSYFDQDANLMVHAYQDGTQWRFETSLSEPGVGSDSYLLLDGFGRAQIAYYNQLNRAASFFVEPHFLDYSDIDAAQDEDLSNTRLCEQGLFICDEACVDIMSEEHCGGCGNQCIQGAACIAGECTCPAEQIECDWVCTDISVEENHCGCCGNQCIQGAACVAGECACPDGEIECDGSCHTPDWFENNTENCGACGEFCGGRFSECLINDCIDSGDWVSLQGGVFQMGSNDYGPIHEVSIPAFEIWRTEVTVAQYGLCVNAGACTEPNTGGRCNWNAEGRDDYPINCVDWSQARAFAAWAGGRLPSEAEWEYAARSQGLERVYPWGDEAATCERAVMDDGGDGCGEGGTWPVCSKPAGNSVQGLCDMSGNAWEWVEDCYESYHHTPVDGSSLDECLGSRWDRVLRGGGSWDGPAYLRAASRTSDIPVGGLDFWGFRLARSSP